MEKKIISVAEKMETNKMEINKFKKDNIIFRFLSKHHIDLKTIKLLLEKIVGKSKSIFSIFSCTNKRYLSL